MKIKTWIKDHKKEVATAAGITASVVISATLYHFGYNKGYVEGASYGSAVSARATRKALNLDADAIDAVIKALPEAQKEIMAEINKK